MVRSLAAPLGATATTFYVSFLVEPRGTLEEAALSGFFGLTLVGDANELFIGKPGAGAVNEYVLEQRGGAGQVSSGAPVRIGTVALLVAKVELVAGNDVVTLYVNPTPQLREPATGAIKADLDLGTVTQVGVYSTGAFALDELRIGSTWSDVVPAPE